MSVYYNENEPFCVAWLRELIKEGHIADGIVDDRSITEIKAHELTGFDQHHFFAGIGGWSAALRLAGVSDRKSLWTASLPCQPFSAAGKQRGIKDARHLWPVFLQLVKACQPEEILGEQVASSEVIGTQLEADFLVAVQTGQFARANKLAKRLATSNAFHYHPRWLSGVRSDLDQSDYSLRTAILGAHSAGSPNLRQRLFWMAHANRGQRDGITDGERCQLNGSQAGRVESEGQLECSSPNGTVADTNGGNAGTEREQSSGEHGQLAEDGGVGGLEHPTRNGRQQWWSEPSGRSTFVGRLESVALGDTDEQRSQGWRERWYGGNGRAAWASSMVIACTDGKNRRIPIEPEFQPLASRVSGRVGLLRGYGNAINIETAAAFIQAALGAADDRGVVSELEDLS